MTELALGLDLGTHGARALAAGVDGTIHAQGAYPYQRHIESVGVQEQPLDPVWRALCESTRQVLTTLKPGEHIDSLAVTDRRGCRRDAHRFSGQVGGGRDTFAN